MLSPRGREHTSPIEIGWPADNRSNDDSLAVDHYIALFSVCHTGWRTLTFGRKRQRNESGDQQPSTVDGALEQPSASGCHQVYLTDAGVLDGRAQASGWAGADHCASTETLKKEQKGKGEDRAAQNSSVV